MRDLNNRVETAASAVRPGRSLAENREQEQKLRTGN